MENNYKIPLRELPVGRHEIEFDLNDDFFALFEKGEVKRGAVEAQLDIQRHNNLMLISFLFGGGVEVICDRCLDTFLMPIESQFNLSVRFSALMAEREGDYAVDEDADEDIVFVDPSDDELDLGVYMYESVCLSLPIQRVHPDDDEGNILCNPEMMKYIQQTVNNGSDDEDIDIDSLFDDDDE